MQLIKDGRTLIRCSTEQMIKAILFVFILFFAMSSGVRAVGLFTYYPRMLDAHAALGNLLFDIGPKYNLDSFLIGDAGVASYNSNLIVLDNAGLGSSRVLKEGVTNTLIDDYGVDLVAFYATPQAIQWSLFSQHFVHQWTEQNKLFYACDVYWRHDYTFKIYLKQPIPEIMSLCEKSKQLNDHDDSRYFSQIALTPPWHYWHH